MQGLRDFNTPVLLIVFNREETTRKILETLNQIKPIKLYIACDGPRKDVQNEHEQISSVRKLVSKTTWNCEVKTLFQDENLGCKKGVVTAINWFFSHETKGIILEDDCLPNIDFFIFCQQMLNQYEFNENIYSISGNNFQKLNFYSSYYFSKYLHIWGWATWKRAWVVNDENIKFWPKWKKSIEWKNFFSSNLEKKYWENLFDKAYNNEIDTWDYSWIASVWYHNGISITPKSNLVTNIGFGLNATHTLNSNSKFSHLKRKKIKSIKFKNKIKINLFADFYTFFIVYDGYKYMPIVNFFIFLKNTYLKKINDKYN
jgi:hypothetical protein